MSCARRIGVQTRWQTQNERLVKILVPSIELADDLLADLEGVA